MLGLEAYSEITINSVVWINSYSDYRWVKFIVNSITEFRRVAW
jgi:hypothetical protein